MMTTNDILRNILEVYNPNENQPSNGMKDLLKALEELRIYTNDHLLKIKKRFNNVTPCIYPNYSTFENREPIVIPA